MNNTETKPAAVVVNDDTTQLGILSGLLAKAGVEARAFESAEAALTAIDPADPPDLVVTDLYMPGIDGWRFCRLLRSPEHEAFNAVPILVVSATFAGDHSEHISADVGADAFLPSPVDGKVFTAQIKALLTGKEARRLPRALIVEDGKTLAGLLKKTFAANGYRVDVALTVREAEATFAKTPYDVAVLDYHLPDGTGDALLDALQTERPDCVCLMMTTDPTPELALDWMKRGAAAYLRKPFEPEFLIELCARARRERSLLRVKDLLEVRTRELRASEEHLSATLRSIGDGVVACDREGKVTSINREAEILTGWTSAEAAGRPLEDVFRIINTQTRETADNPVARALAEGVNVDLANHTALIAKDGTEHQIADSCAPIRDTSGAVSGAVLVFRDVTEAYRRREALRESEEQYRLLVKNMHAGVVVHAPDTQIILANEQACRLLGLSLDQMTGKTAIDPAWRFVREDETVMPLEEYPVNHVLATRQPIRDLVIGIDSPATEDRIWVLANAFPELDADGRLRQVVVTFFDITEHKRAEAEQEKLQAQLNQAQKMESVGRLAGGVAHDFNNMLGVIIGHADMILEEIDTDQPFHADITEIRKAGERSADLTRQLLAFARKQTVAPKVLDLNGTIKNMLKMLQRLIGEDIDLLWKPGHGLWPIKIDPSQVDQILANLCINARDAIPDVGKVTIETGKASFDEDYCARHAGFVPGDYALLAVSDDGSGMDAETLDNVFEPFFTTKESGKGIGLGLATVYGVVKQNQGFINIYSEPGQGATFKIYLPRYLGKAAPLPGNGQGADTPAERGHETILLVEDELTILRMTRMMLERKGYIVLSAAIPTEAIEKAKIHSGSIDLLMTDVVMPEMNGRDLAGQIVHLYPDIRLLFMSGYTANVIAHQGVLDDGVAFIQKPFSMADMTEKVRVVLDMASDKS